MRNYFRRGELAMIHPNFHSGVWLRKDIKLPESSEVVGHIPSNSLITILEIVESNALIISNTGVLGWTWENRLKKIQ